VAENQKCSRRQTLGEEKVKVAGVYGKVRAVNSKEPSSGPEGGRGLKHLVPSHDDQAAAGRRCGVGDEAIPERGGRDLAGPFQKAPPGAAAGIGPGA